jgi:HK97 family phage prohead protease
MEHKRCRFEIKSLTDEGTFTGYGAMFNNVDYGGDIILPGAFSKSLAEIKDSGRKVPALWQHNSDEPVGYYDDLTEDDKGLKVSGQLIMGVQKAKEAHMLMKNGVISGLSIGYGVNDSSTDDQTGIRTLKELDLYEVSPVTFPMNDMARVNTVKNSDFRMSLKQFEQALRDLGFSRSVATAVASKGYRHLLQSESADEEKAKQVADVLRNFKLTA